MKTIIILIAIVSLNISAVMAQVTTSSTTKKTNVSIHTDSDDSKKSNVSISISSTDDYYSFSAKYSGDKDDELKDLLKKEMGTQNLKESKGKYTWEVNSGNEQVYEIELKNGKLSMEIDKTIASKSLIEKFEQLGKTARTIITGKDEEDREMERVQREADRLQRDADRMRREAERLRDQAVRDADRLSREAERLAREAARAGNIARHSGGVSSGILKLLNDSKTYFDGKDTDHNWILPKLDNDLSSQLLMDGLISSSEDINLTKDGSGIYINGNKLNSSETSKYNSLFKDHKVPDNMYLSFNKQGHHIVIIDEKADVEELLNAMKKANYISSISEKLKLEINGNSVVKNGRTLSHSDVLAYNGLLQKHKVIPAPGKILEIMAPGNYKLGYTIDDKAHLGTWIMQN